MRWVPVLLLEAPRRRRALIALGAALGVGFLLVRGLNGYGDPHPWAHQRSSLFTAMSFLNTTKYPPSLDYLLMTLGPILLLLAAAEKLRGSSSVRAGGLRARAFLLLRAAPLPDPRAAWRWNLDRNRSGAASDRLAALPQLVSASRSLVSTWLGSWSWWRSTRMPLVCSRQGDEAGLVVGLSLIQSG